MPNIIKERDCTNFKKNFIAVNATTNDPIKPITKRLSSEFENVKLESIRSSVLAANMVGTASRNEKITAVSLFIPINLPPIILAAERDTPGIIEID